MNKRVLGKEKERLACEFLERHGIEVIETNFSCRFGEIDIVARENGTVCFVEVKYRSSAAYGYPEEHVDTVKQKKICRTADFYIGGHGCGGRVRFDVVSILPDRIRLIRNAFSYI